MCQRTNVKVRNKQHALYLKLCQDELRIKYQDKLIKWIKNKKKKTCGVNQTLKEIIKQIKWINTNSWNKK